MLLQILATKSRRYSATAMRGAAAFRNRGGSLCFFSSSSHRGYRNVISASSFAVSTANSRRQSSSSGTAAALTLTSLTAKKRSLSREDFLSVDEALGGRFAPPLQSYDDDDSPEEFSFGEEQNTAAGVMFDRTSPASSPIDQDDQSSLSSYGTNFPKNEQFDDGEPPLVEEQMVLDVLRYRPTSPGTTMSPQVPPVWVPRSTTSEAIRSFSTQKASQKDDTSSYVSPNAIANDPPSSATPISTNQQQQPQFMYPTFEELEMKLKAVVDEITAQNNGEPVNVNSNKQVSTLLFGTSGHSTLKDVLEGMAGAGNRMADLILQYRDVKHRLRKMQRRKDSVAKGTAVNNAMTVKRVHNETYTEDDDQRDPLILVDVSAYIFRAYYSMPPIHRSDGMPTGAVMGFCKMLNAMLLDSMIDGKQPRLVLCFDAKGHTFRHDMYPKYKGNRPNVPIDLIPQFDFVREAAKAYGIAQIEASGFEADDVIATLATRAIDEGVDANILSGDKDLMQLITGLGVTPSIQMTDPMKRECSTYKEVVEKWSVAPSLLGDVLALAGDAADNVPGVKGIGPKTAAKLINEHGSLEKLLENIDSIKAKGVREKLAAGQDNARLSRQLVDLRRDVPLTNLVGFPAEAAMKVRLLRMQPLDPNRILGFYERMGFQELQRTLKSKLEGKKVLRKTVTRRPKVEVPRPEDYLDVPF